MKTPLKQAMQSKLEHIELGDDQLDALLGMQQAQQNTVAENDSSEDKNQAKAAPDIKSKPRSRRLWRVGIAASVLMMMITLAMVFTLEKHPPETSQWASNTMIERIANEVAKNHIKMKPLEVQTETLVELQRYFTELDFAPVLSPVFESGIDAQLAGGRYCSIQGSTAAQLRYRDNQGRYMTLFETPYDEALFKTLPDVDKGQEPVTVYARGVKVSVWVEKGLLMASTGE